MKIIFSILILLLASADVRAEPAAPITLGWSGPLTGNCAVVGVDTVPALQGVIDEVNAAGGIGGRPLALEAEDDGYDVVRAVSAYKKLARADGAIVIFAETYGGVFATAKDAAADGVLVIDTLDCNEDLASLPQNSLCLATKTESISAGFTADIVGRGFRSVLLLVEESDGWMQLIARSARSALEASGVQVLEESALPSSIDYRTSLLRAKARHAEAIVLLGNDQMGNAVRQARELGMRAQLYGVGSVLSPGFQAVAGGNVDGTRVSSWRAPRAAPAYQEFLRKFTARAGRAPYLELAVVPAVDALHLVVDCLKRLQATGAAPNADGVRECLLSTHDYEGLAGRLSFDSDGAVRSIREQLFSVRNGVLVDEGGAAPR